MKDLIILSAVISAIIVGFRCITAKGMIFYFLREWLDKKTESKKEWKRLNAEVVKSENWINANDRTDENGDNWDEVFYYIEAINKQLRSYDVPTSKGDALNYLMKPVILCGTCMASVHTLIWYPVLTGDYGWRIIPVMLMVAFLNTLLYGIIELIQKHS